MAKMVSIHWDNETKRCFKHGDKPYPCWRCMRNARMDNEMYVLLTHGERNGYEEIDYPVEFNEDIHDVM